ncbi:hypothetical protein BCR32DRAFT_39485 [Anaeromyces robustus]|uniref:CBM10 domain-containing protein n=1 Tax=Anaeromyces robustus TaxID=1754192 RepID=A0A1Y1WZL6_9FUNG|nr:hypothetical protein BCR32DRAFT_39485 [Anaeromyces robustus]|eukprot:ORX79037.1 hypothetical protein BCR32DRAFT_39485 [Anaeromyces robustus]
MCGTPDPNDPLAGNANAKTTLPTNFPFLKDNGYVLPDDEGNEEPNTKTKTTTTTTKKSEPTNGATCWSKSIGYECCKETTTAIYNDENGKWGYENGDWCGIVEECSGSECDDTKCAGYPEYPCCKGCDISYSDESGDWGVENGKWCGIKASCNGSNAVTPTKTCFSEPDYPCCNSCNIVETDALGRWGVENGEWCGIPDSCSTKEKRAGFTILPVCHNPLPTCVALYDQCGGEGYFGPTECCKGKCTSQGP